MLETIRKQNTNTHDEWIRLGQEFRQKQQWGDAINAYKKALELQSEGAAKVALAYIYEILAYRNSDLFNP